MNARRDACYFQSLRKDPDVQGALSLFRIWQKNRSHTMNQHCHILYTDNAISISEEGQSILNQFVPVLTV